MYNSTIEYEEFKDKYSENDNDNDNESNTENELYMSVCEEPELESELDLEQESNLNSLTIERPKTTLVKASWMPNIDFYNSCDFRSFINGWQLFDTWRIIWKFSCFHNAHNFCSAYYDSQKISIC